jgi:hypothetical protein
LAFFAQTAASFCHNIAVEKNAYFPAENRQKSRKCLIKTSIPVPRSFVLARWRFRRLQAVKMFHL